MLFASDLEEIYEAHAGALEEAGDAQLVGCTGDGAFTEGALVPRGWAAAYLPAEEACFGVAYAELDGHGLAHAAHHAAQLARRRAEAALEHSVLLLMSPGRAGDQREVVRAGGRWATWSTSWTGGRRSRATSPSGAQLELDRPTLSGKLMDGP